MESHRWSNDWGRKAASRGKAHTPLKGVRTQGCEIPAQEKRNCGNGGQNTGTENPLWHSWLRIWCCPCCGSDHCCGLGSAPCLGTSTCRRCGQKKKGILGTWLGCAGGSGVGTNLGRGYEGSCWGVKMFQIYYICTCICIYIYIYIYIFADISVKLHWFVPLRFVYVSIPQ